MCVYLCVGDNVCERMFVSAGLHSMSSCVCIHMRVSICLCKVAYEYKHLYVPCKVIQRMRMFLYKYTSMHTNMQAGLVHQHCAGTVAVYLHA